MVVAVFPGRFQPLHRGTFQAIRHLDRRHHVVIAVRNAATMNTASNPLSFSERKHILDTCLPGHDIFPIADGGSLQDLVDHTADKIAFQTLVSGDSDVRDAFKEQGYSTESPRKYREDTYSGEKTRMTAAENDGRWKDLVPSCSIQLLEQFNFPERMEQLYS
ncbi:MAG: hypothetical protein SVU32_09215 [Candidatus Nanohaloarchaea archaeon]|nr:hypothetical protein [Candidatus Nanohaloarchaea archaeon]